MRSDSRPKAIRALAAALAVIIAIAVAPPARAVDFVVKTLISDGNPLTNDLGRANTNINGVPIKRNALTTVGDYQFTSYYLQDGKIAIGRRHTGAATWDLFRTQFTPINIDDDHDISSIAVDGDGVLHMSWGMHGHNLLYTKSTASVVNNNPIVMTGASTGNAGAINNMTGLYNSTVTYPDFYNLPDGDLLFLYRNGGSGDGDYRLRRYDTATDLWSELGDGPSNIWLGKQAPGSTLPNVSAYPQQLAFDSQGNIHAAWTYRTGGDTTTGEPGFQTNHDFYYAKSPDQGATWTNQSGVPYTSAIYETNAQKIIDLPEGSSLINTAGMAVDKLNQPVIASWWAPGAPQGNHARQYMLAWYDNGQQAWRTSQISHRTIDGPAKTTEGAVRDLGRPIVVVDDDNRVIVAYRDNDAGNSLTIAYSQSPQRDDWKSFDLTTDDLGGWEPTFDLNRWNNDRVLSFLYQSTSLGQMGSPISVLEWDSKGYFHDLAAPKLTLRVNRNSGIATLVNNSGETISIDGYSVASAGGQLRPATWQSLADQHIGQWEESNPSVNRLSELNQSGSLTLTGATKATLGSLYKPNAATLAQSLGAEDLKLEFTTADGDIINGLVEYQGYGNLVVVVNPLTGDAVLHNYSTYNVGLEAYTISSADGSLLPANGNWNSLADQGAGGGGWDEANPSDHRLSELKMTGAYLFNAGNALALGKIFDVTSGQDLELDFFTADTGDSIAGIVVFAIPGDFDENGVVDGADLLSWQRGESGSPWSAADLADWKANFGKRLPGSAAPVPEPQAMFLIGWAVVLLAIRAPTGRRRFANIR